MRKAINLWAVTSGDTCEFVESCDLALYLTSRGAAPEQVEYLMDEVHKVRTGGQGWLRTGSFSLPGANISVARA